MAVRQKTVLECICERCGHAWQPRTSEPSLRCPGCLSPYWQRPKTEKKQKDTQEEKSHES